ncbi:MAG TPA: hypothetical protein DF383_14105 [Deltaproteobacteria bacterium]|nr:hypothetical protein [Deltaproteobacteria bacterium]
MNRCLALKFFWLHFIPVFFLAACGGGGEGIAAHVLVEVTEADGRPVAGASVWVPADEVVIQGFESSAALVDALGNTCPDPPDPVLFAACTGPDGLALLQCPAQSLFLLKYRSGDREGVTNARCSAEGVVPAPL